MISPTVIWAVPEDTVMTVDGGVMLGMGVMTPLSGTSGPIVTGQNPMLVTTKGARLMRVVKVVVTVPLEEYSAVP